MIWNLLLPELARRGFARIATFETATMTSGLVAIG